MGDHDVHLGGGFDRPVVPGSDTHPLSKAAGKEVIGGSSPISRVASSIGDLGSESPPIQSKHSLRAMPSAQTSVMGRVGQAISRLWFRATLTDKKAQATVARLGESFAALPQSSKWHDQTEKTKGEQIVGLLVAPNTRLALRHFADTHMLQGPHKEEFLALLDELDAHGDTADQEQRALNCIRAAKILGILQVEAHFDKEGAMSSLPIVLSGANGAVDSRMRDFTVALITASRPADNSASRDSDVDLKDPNVLLTTEGLRYYAADLDPDALFSMLRCERNDLNATQDVARRFERLCAKPLEDGASPIQKMAYGHRGYHHAMLSLAEIERKKDYSAVQDFTKAGQQLASAATFLGSVIDDDAMQTAMKFFSPPPCKSFSTRGS